MGSYNDTEICELVVIYTLSKLKSITAEDDIRLYCDDSLIRLKGLNGKQTDKMRKNIIKVIKTNGFQIEIETNLHKVNFPDITFNLRSGTYHLYKKPNVKLFPCLLYQTTLLKSSDSSHVPSTRDYATILPIKLYLNRPN